MHRHRQRPERAKREHPRGRDDRRLEKPEQDDPCVHRGKDRPQPPERGNADEVREATEARRTQEDGQDLVVADAGLLRDVVEREENRAREDPENPAVHASKNVLPFASMRRVFG